MVSVPSKGGHCADCLSISLFPAGQTMDGSEQAGVIFCILSEYCGWASISIRDTAKKDSVTASNPLSITMSNIRRMESDLLEARGAQYLHRNALVARWLKVSDGRNDHCMGTKFISSSASPSPSMWREDARISLKSTPPLSNTRSVPNLTCSYRVDLTLLRKKIHSAAISPTNINEASMIQLSQKAADLTTSPDHVFRSSPAPF